jgi:hypothetical protein
MKIGDWVWKSGGEAGYSGAGKIVATFKNWMGQPRYVVEHQIEGGRGFFYHIYGPKELKDSSDDTPSRETR